MSRSFFTFTNDAEFAGGSNAFLTKVSLSPESYGLDETTVAQYAVLHDAFIARLKALSGRNDRSTVLVIAKNEARRALASFASEISKRVQGSGVSDDVRASLGLSVRKSPGPLPPPGRPHSFALTLPGNGDVKLTWKCSNPRGAVGTMYQVYRKINDETDYTYLGGVGGKSYIDTSLPMGASNIEYQVQAVRSTAAGEWATFHVMFGKASAAKLYPTVTVNNLSAA